MKKIMFNDRFGLTQAVIERRKTKTRWMEGDKQFQLAAAETERFYYEPTTGYLVMTSQDGEIFRHKLRYKLCDVVAVAQSYQAAGLDRDFIIERYMTDNGVLVDRKASYSEGWRNKMFVRPDLMPHRIRITGIHVEQLQDISDEECMKEGVRVEYAENGRAGYYIFDSRRMRELWHDTPRDAFAALIDKVCGRGTWDNDPWVVVYEFELIK